MMSRVKILFSGMALLCFICGCAVNQTRDIGIYREVLNSGESGDAVQYQPDEPLTLRQALRLANERNEQLAIAGEDYLQTLIDKQRAFAAFLPTISFAPRMTLQKETSLGAGNPLISEFAPSESTDMPIEGNMSLHPFRDVPMVYAAGSSVRAKKALLLDQQAVLMLEIAETFFQVMHSERQADVLRHSIKVGEERLADTKTRRKAGMARPVDVSLAEARLAQTRNKFIQVEDDIENGRTTLAFLIGVPAINGPLVNNLDMPVVDRQDLLLQEFADTHRQDLIASQEQVKTAKSALEAAWGRYFPSVSLNLDYYLSRDSFPSDVDLSSLIRVNVPIFSAGLVHADVREAYSRLRQARLVESYTRRRVLKDLHVALETLKKDDLQISQLNIRTQASQVSLKHSDAAFETGLGTNLERLIAQDELLSAELALAAAEFNRNVDYLRLLRVTGTLTPDLSTALPAVKNGPNGSINERDNDTNTSIEE